MSKCQGIIGAIFGHKFSPRYDEGKPMPYELKNGFASELADVLRASKPITYRHDVCERCGVIVEKHNKLEV